MTKDPWTDPDPQPGDFDADLTDVDPRYVEVHSGNADEKLVPLDEPRPLTPADRALMDALVSEILHHSR
jgi:hypothetical protein